VEHFIRVKKNVVVIIVVVVVVVVVVVLLVVCFGVEHTVGVVPSASGVDGAVPQAMFCALFW